MKTQVVIYTIAVYVMAEPCLPGCYLISSGFAALSIEASSKSPTSIAGRSIGYCDNSILYVEAGNEDFIEVALH